MADAPRRRPARETYDLADDAEPLPRPRSRSRSRRYEDEDEPRPRRRKRPLLDEPLATMLKVGAVAGVLFIALVVGGICFAVWNAKRAPFRPHMATYLASGGPANPAAPRQGSRKLLVVDVQDKDVDSLHFDLPDNVRAATPADVNTVAQLRWTKATVGTYTSGGSAYQWSCDVTVIDLPTRATLGSQRILGSAPPQTFYGKAGESRSGDKPTEQVLSYLRSLSGG